MNVIGNAADQECERWLNNRAENYTSRCGYERQR